MPEPHQLKGYHPSHTVTARGVLQEKVLFSTHCTDGIDVSEQKATKGTVGGREKRRLLGRHADEKHR